MREASRFTGKRSNNVASIDETINEAFRPIASAISEVVFYSVPIGESEFPLIVVWLIAGAFYFTVYLKLINVRLHSHKHLLG